MDWYLIYTKPREERTALLNLQQQGFECYLPMLQIEKLKHKGVCVIEEPLFKRYLFIRLDTSHEAKGWGSIRSTKGVSRLVTFGQAPASIDENLVENIRMECSQQGQPVSLFKPKERLMIEQGAFAGLEAIFEMTDGEGRAMVLIQLLSKPCRLPIPAANLRKIG